MESWWKTTEKPCAHRDHCSG